MARMVSKKYLFSLNPFDSARDVLLAIASGMAIALIVWLLSLLFSPDNWSLRGGVLGAIAAVLVTLVRLLPVAGVAERSTRNAIISHLNALNYEFERRDDNGNFYFRRIGNVLTRWDAERVVIFVRPGAEDRIVAPFAVMRTL